MKKLLHFIPVLALVACGPLCLADDVFKEIEPLPIIEAPELPESLIKWIEAQKTGICHIHKIPMEKKTVPIIYGLVKFENPPPKEIKESMFPHSNEYSLGGCVTTPDSPKEKSLYVCPECKKAETVWRKEHPAKKIKE